MTINNHQNSQESPSLIAISTTLTLLDGHEGASVTADFHYNPQEPYTVRMILGMPGTPSVTWEFSRDLLRAGLLFAVGIGDVRIQPHPYGLIIELIHQGGISKFFAFPEPVIDFVGRSLRAVPEGTESDFHTLDQELANLFGDPTRSAESNDGANSEG